MDKELAAIYGTGQPEVDESDLEKTAAAELLVKLAEEQGVDLNDFSDEEVAEMLGDLYEGGVEHTAAAQEAPATQEKYAEADYLGRIMAHSMVQELDSIEKEAGLAQKIKSYAARAGEATGAGDIISGLRGRALASKIKGEGAKIMKDMPSSGRAQELFRKAKHVDAGAQEALSAGGKRFGKRVGIPAAALATGVGAGYATKNASAVETLAEQRAYELASEAGYIDKEASALDQAVEYRALEICEANGIPVEWNG